MWIGATMSLIHGLNISVSTSSFPPFGIGLPFVFAAIAQTYLLVQAIPAFRHVAAPPREPAPAVPAFARHARTVT
jgi:hypothetical protein